MKIFFRFAFVFLLFLSLFSCRQEEETIPAFSSLWPNTQRTFLGPDYWANRLQDWQIRNGRLECLVSGPNRNVYLLTHELHPDTATTEMRIRLGFTNLSAKSYPQNWAGFRLGVKGKFDDYRDNAVYGTGLDVGVTALGELFIGNPSTATASSPLDYMSELEIGVKIKPDSGGYSLLFTVYNPQTGKVWESVKKDSISQATLSGGLALVSHFEGIPEGQTLPSVWFADWQIRGKELIDLPENAYGPIMFSHYTLSKNILKMTAQMAPVGPDDDGVVHLEVKVGEKWVELAEAAIDPMARTATFRVDEWTSEADIPYRLRYQMFTGNGTKTPYFHEGLIRKDPVDKEMLVVAGFTGNNDLGFPNKDLTLNVLRHNPDLLFFSGDQIYEGVGGYGVQRFPVEKATLDYLRKWYIFGWTYREMLKDRPSISIPDDHDVYHGNIWGEGGKATGEEGNDFDKQDRGGYKMPAEWVRMVERTQTAHLPDPYDPTPVLQGIGVYYTSMVYGGVSFAIIEDRKFKSAPKALLPEAEINNGWAQNRNFDAKTRSDVPTATLLGERQLDFLEAWTADWSGNAKMKCLLSQTIFANVATLPEEEYHDNIVPRLRILEKGAYAPNDRAVSDMDSNGWPQTGRNKALRIIRKGFAFHLAGDQHLGSTIQYGVDEWGDAPYALCVPSVSNVWPRRWYPKEGGANRRADTPQYTGDFEDGFGNKMTVQAVSNPVFTGREPANLYDRATGYGIVRFEKPTRKITIECWPRDTDPTQADAREYEGWPITIHQQDNYGRKPAGWLPTVKVSGMFEPVVQVIREGTGEVIYTLRIQGNTFEPYVFEPGRYTLRVGEPETGQVKVFSGINSTTARGKESLKAEF
ncbi:MAG: alkaline phosphatase D family protein [Bacteroidia bacterium]|nr:alkaline phosphatase D family protein [Bacteroidia bacterium]